MAMVHVEPEERIRRFWRAHARSFAHLTVLHAFSANRTLTWTPERLTRWYGIREDRARAVVRELAGCGILQAAEGVTEEYRWSPALDWVDPASPGELDVVKVAQTIRDVLSAGPGREPNPSPDDHG